MYCKGNLQVKVLKVPSPTKKSIGDWAKEMLLWEILKGMSVTFRRMFNKRVTLRYPEEKWILPERFRGQVGLVRNHETPDKDLCVGCCLCVRVCPPECIDMVTSRGPDNEKIIDEYIIDTSRCIFCGKCVEICPVDALVSTDLYELTVKNRDEMIKDKPDLLHDGMDYESREKSRISQGEETMIVVKVRKDGKTVKVR